MLQKKTKQLRYVYSNGIKYVTLQIMSIKALIEQKLGSLNGTGDHEIFEEVGQKCVQYIVNHQPMVFSHSGNTYRGDGGVDGFIMGEDYSHFRIAYSIKENWKEKLKEEAEKKAHANYKGLLFCSNQEIQQNEAEKIIGILQQRFRYPIRILSRSHLVSVIENIPDCLSILGIPTELNRLEIQHLAKHNQFGQDKSKIDCYVPRRIIKDADYSPIKDTSLPLSEYVKNLPDVSLMISPAGYGKTCALKQICNYILSNPDCYTLPPVYLSASKYSTGNLCNMIESIVVSSPDYKLNDSVLFIDGIDELSDENLNALVKDLCSWTMNKSLIRKLFFSGRTNEFGIEALKPLGPIETVLLKEPASEEINQLIDSRLLDDNDRITVKNYIYKNFYDANLFFIDKAVLFYKENKRLPKAIWELLEFTSSKDVCNICRVDDCPNLIPFEREAFKAILLKSDTITIQGHKIRTDDFSHKYVIEYLAAKHLTTYSARIITGMVTAKKKYILPRLKNTVGLTLSLLANNRDKTKLNYLLSQLSSEYFNVDSLIKCDSPNLDKEIKTNLIKTSTEYMLESFDVYSFNKDYSRLFFDSYVKEANLNWFISRIEEEKNESVQSILFDIAFYLSVNNKHDIPRSFTCYLKTKLYEYIERKNDTAVYGSISSILYSLATLSYKNLFTTYDISKLVTFLETRYWKHECFNNTCKILSKCEILPSLSDFKKLIRVYFQISKFTHSNSFAHFVPNQIGDDYDPQPFEIQRTDAFHPMALEVINSIPESLWMIIRLFLEAQGDDKHHLSMEKTKLLETLSEAVVNTFNSGKTLSEEEIGLVHNLFILNPFSPNIFRSSLEKNAEELVEQLFIRSLDYWENTNQRYEYFSIFRNFIMKMVSDKTLFLDVVSKQKLTQEEFENKIDIMSYFRSSSDNTLSELTDSNRAIALIQINNAEKYKTNRLCHEEIISSSIHQIFDKAKNLKELRKVFKTVNRGTITFDDTFQIDMQNDSGMHNNEISPFSLFFVQTMLRGEKQTLSEEEAIDFWDDDSEWKKIFFLVNYISHFNLSYSLLNSSELDFIKNWVIRTLEKNPIRNNEDNLIQAHIYIAMLLGNPEIGVFLKDAVYPIRENIKGFITAGIVRMIHDGVVNPEDASFDYLETYFTKTEIISQISDSLDYVLGNRNALQQIGRYLSKNFSTKTMSLYDFSSIKMRIVEYINSHFNEEDYYFSCFDSFFEAAGITSDLFPIGLYLDTLKFDEKEQRYKSSLASFFLKVYGNRTKSENLYINKLMKRLFNISSSNYEKKYLAELLLHYDHSSFHTFNWYAKLLLSDNSTAISENLRYNEEHHCDSPMAMRYLKKLWKKYGDAYNEKGQAIGTIVSNSILGIIKNSKHKSIVFAIIMRMLDSLEEATDRRRIIRLRLRCIHEYTNISRPIKN